ncbi:hypothetical protein A2U01_0059669, partial [Trifolium medium]|nr:hypothetical protein [Trifolium medium]
GILAELSLSESEELELLAGRAETAEVSVCTRWARMARSGEESQKSLSDF